MSELLVITETHELSSATPVEQLIVDSNCTNTVLEQVVESALTEFVTTAEVLNEIVESNLASEVVVHELLETAVQGPPGPVGPAGGDDPISPSFFYTSGLLTSVTYPDGSSKTLTYLLGLLSQLDFTRNNVTTRKTYNYVAGILSSVVQTTL